MKYHVEQMDSFQVIGFEKSVSYENAFQDCPAFWDEYREKYARPDAAEGSASGRLEQAVAEHRVGEYGVNVCEMNGSFRYYIAGDYRGGDVPKGMSTFTFPAMEWAKFTARGKMPEALQSLNRELFCHWLPQHKEYELEMDANVEWYSEGDSTAEDYEFGIWIPVRRKKGA